MKNSNVASTNCQHVSIKYHLIAALLIISGIILPVNSIYSATLTGNDKQCTFSIQLQSSPFREQYIASLAMDLGSMVASNTPDESTVQSDAPWFVTLLIGSPETSSHVNSADVYSQGCLACHDGSEASEIHANITNAPGNALEHKYAGGKDHPIGMNYQAYVGFGRGKFKSVSMFNSDMKFVNGRVGCLTCHNPLNPEKMHLVMSDVGSALCRTCHNM